MTLWKLVAALVGAVALALETVLVDGILSQQDAVVLVGAAAAAFGTWLVPNTPQLETAKSWVCSIVLGVGVLVPLAADGVGWADGLAAVIAVLTAAGVYRAPGPEAGPAVSAVP